jgi:hypothetical protein
MNEIYSIVNDSLEIEYIDNSDYVQIYIKDRDLLLQIHKIQLTILSLYNGKRNVNIVYDQLIKENNNTSLSLKKLEKFEKKAITLGLLINNSYRNINDPFVGIEYSFSKKKKQPKTILKILEPDNFFKETVQWFKNKKNLLIIIFIIFFVIYTFSEVINSYELFKYNLQEAIYLPYWIFLFYPLWFIVMLLHEFSHAIACRILNIHVEEVGIGRRGFLLVGWVKPNQNSWSKLNYSSKLFTIIVGPLLNIFISSIDLFGWLIFEGQAIKLFMLTIGVIPLMTMVPTLLPTNKGDAYLLLTEYFDLKELYSKSIKYILTRNFYYDIVKKEISIGLLIFGLLSLATRGLMQFTFFLLICQAIYVLYIYTIN